MAKKEETEYPAYIDYEGNDVTNPVETWSTTQFEEHWRKLLVKHHRSAAARFNLKERTQLKRLFDQYGDKLKDMMDWWVTNRAPTLACSFAAFYGNRDNIYIWMQPKDYTWD